MRRVACIAALGLVCAAAGRAPAKIDLVTLPARDQTQVTIYNSEDLTLVRETRTITFSQGLNRIEFSWANTLIDPTSPRLFFLERPADFEVIDIVYPANTRDLLQWNVEAASAGPARVEITYFISGLTWTADYVVKATPDETRASIEGYIRVGNQSGEDFLDAQTRVLVGTVNLIEKIADLARRGIVYDPRRGAVSTGDVWRVRDGDAQLLYAFDAVSGPATETWAWAQKDIKEVAKQAISEYQLFTIEGTEDLPNGWSKRLRSFAADDVRIEVAYEFDEGKYGPEIVKLYKIKNDAEHNLGESPFPQGIYRVLRDDAEGGLLWGGQHSDKYIPVGEKLKLNLGPDGLIQFEPKVMDFERRNLDFDSQGNVRGWEERTLWRLELRNSKSDEIPVKLVRVFEGDWGMEPMFDMAAVTHKVRDARTMEFETRVGAQSTEAIEFFVTQRFGTRSTNTEPPVSVPAPTPAPRPRPRTQ